jgi:hypothetical protein
VNAVLVTATSTAYGLSPALLTLVMRIEWIWQTAGLTGDLRECARNALAVVMMPVELTDAQVKAIFADALLHRRNELGFERVNEYTAPFLGEQAMFLWRSYEETQRAEAETRRFRVLTAETLPAPAYSPMTDYSTCTEDASCRCGTCEAESEARHARSCYGSPDVPEGFGAHEREYDYDADAEAW